MKINIGSDEKRAPLKEKIINYLISKGIEVKDFGESDYVSIARAVAESISKEDYSHGILICRTGIGMQIVANKIPRVYAVRCHDVQSAIDSRQINNSNILTFGDIEESLAKNIVDTYINTSFSKEPKHIKSLEKIKEVEAKYYQI